VLKQRGRYGMELVNVVSQDLACLFITFIQQEADFPFVLDGPFLRIFPGMAQIPYQKKQMAETTPKRLAFLLSILLSIMAAVIVFIFEGFLTDNPHWILIPFTFLGLIFIQYLVFSFSLENFIFSYF